MEISIKSITLFATVILTGLSAGLFYAWMVSVIPGTQKIGDLTYLQTMQSINRAILNPAFYLIFMGSLVLLFVSSIYLLKGGLAFGLGLAAAILYLLGTFGVTVLGNVPLNDQLDQLVLAELSLEKLMEFREFYEANWNRLHWIRTLFSVLSFVLSLMAFYGSTRP